MNFDNNNLKAISLRQITGENYDVIQLSRELHEVVLKKLGTLQSGGFSNLLHEYNENLFCRNQMVRLKKGNIVFETEIKGISAAGELITKDVMERRFGFDEVQWIDLH
jgi:BirA family biotin operon repressor/biotin-[acetyl-CoA-carboxylase] ligase